MPDILRLTMDFALPADLFERSELITRIGGPINELSAVLGKVTGKELAITHAIVGDEPVVAPKKRGRKPRVAAVQQAA